MSVLVYNGFTVMPYNQFIGVLLECAIKEKKDLCLLTLDGPTFAIPKTASLG
jgi:hypothetical protein